MLEKTIGVNDLRERRQIRAGRGLVEAHGLRPGPQKEAQAAFVPYGEFRRNRKFRDGEVGEPS